MPCYHPVPAIRLKDGSVTFVSRDLVDGSDFKLPCSQCVGCRLEYSRQWAIRCLDEASCFKDNCFVTLTFSDDNVKKFGKSLSVVYFQKFMRRLRKEVAPLRIRFFIVVNTLRSLIRIIMRCCLVLIFLIDVIGVCLSLVIISCIAPRYLNAFGRLVFRC